MDGRDHYSRKEELLNEIIRKEGEEHYRNQKYTKAIHSFTQALRHIPDDKKALTWRSKAYSKLRKTRKAIDDIDAALHIDTLYKDAILQKAEVLDQSGNYEMALVYYNRGAKHFPRSQEFKDGIKKAEKNSSRTGRRMKMTATGDLTFFTHKMPPSKSFTWKKKSKENTGNSSVPSATFRMRQGVHPLSRIHRTPTVVLNESRASMTSLLASSLESLAMEKKLIEESSEKTLLGKLYDDKEYLQFLAAAEATKSNSTLKREGSIADAVEDGLYFLQERTQFWDSLGPLPPPHPTKKTNLKRGTSKLSHYTSTESLASVGTVKSYSTFKSYKSTQSNRTTRSKNSNYVSRYAFNPRKEKPKPPKPEKIKFEFASYQRDNDIREMTEILEEPVERKQESEAELKRRHEEAVKRGEEVVALVQKEITEIDRLYAKGQLDVCMKKAESCMDILGRFTDEEVPTKPVLLSTLYSCLGNCAIQTKNYDKALQYHDHDLSIGEQYDMPAVESRALGNLGRVYVLMGKYNRALDIYNRKAPLCTKPQETAWLFHEIGNCFLMMRIFEYAHESGLKALKAANDANSKRLQMQTNVLTGVAEVNLMKYKEAYQHFEQGLEFAKLLNDKKAQDAMTQALVDVNKKMVTQLRKQKKEPTRVKSPQLYNVTRLTPLSRGTLVSAMSAGTSVTAEG